MVPMAENEPKSIFDIEPDEALEALLDAEAEADYAAGRVVPHAKVAEWLKSWGTADELPCPTSKDT
jgi:predicted transcriptional regulator